jgi:hypothetical protein
MGISGKFEGNLQIFARAIADSPLGQEFSESCREILVNQEIPVGLNPAEAFQAVLESQRLLKAAYCTRFGDAWPEQGSKLYARLDSLLVAARLAYIETTDLAPVTLPLRGGAGYGEGGYAVDRQVGEVTFGVAPELAEKFQGLNLTANQVGQICRFPAEQDPRKPSRHPWCVDIPSGGDQWEGWRWHCRGPQGTPEEFFILRAAVKVISGCLL